MTDDASSWTPRWRDRAWSLLDRPWDLIVIGGGITGAGVLRLAAGTGLRALLVEAGDFASGTSSRSSKLVHGGLRYLKNAQLALTLESVRERDRMLLQGRGLVDRLDFIYADLKGDGPRGRLFGLGLVLYDLMAGRWERRAYDAAGLRGICPWITTPGLRGGYTYHDAQTDDARLVLRLLRESVAKGALALSYARVQGLLRTREGRVAGIELRDVSGEAERQAEAKARVVVNATGAWADELRGQLGRAPRLRPLRGSHLLIPCRRLPLARAVAFLHPADRRPVFALPWEGATLFGTTDVDHGQPLVTDPGLDPGELDYLFAALHHLFPEQALTPDDVLSTFSGLRPVVSTGRSDPSRESREHALWEEYGLVTVSGGKLTTFRLMARDALRAARRTLGPLDREGAAPLLTVAPPAHEQRLLASGFSPEACVRLLGRHGAEAVEAFENASPAEREPIADTPYLWAELRHAARAEGVVHLEDLLLRRLRLGLVAPEGAIPLLERIRSVTQPLLGWDDARWQAEAEAYDRLWRTRYSPAQQLDSIRRRSR